MGLALQIEDRDKRIEQLERELKEFKEVSQRVDELTAKQLENEEKLKYQERIISQYQVSAVMLPEHSNRICPHRRAVSSR